MGEDKPIEGKDKMMDAKGIQVQCCVCKRYREGRHWIRRMAGRRLDTSHTYCPACYERLAEKMISGTGDSRSVVI